MWTKLPFLFLAAAVVAAPARAEEGAAAAEHGALAGPPDGVARRLADLERQADRVRLDVEAAHARLQSPPLSRDVDRLRRAARALTHQLRGRPATEVMPLLRRLHRLDKALTSLDARISEPPEPRPRPARDAGSPGSGILTGRVTEAGTGAPVSSFVDVYDAGGDFAGSAHTDGSGLYVVTQLATGTYFVRTDSFDFVDELFNDILCDPQCTVTAGTPVPVTDGQTTGGIDFALLPLGTVEGTIVDAATLLPLENVGLRLYEAGGGGIEFGQSGPDGRYRLEGVHPGVHFLLAEDDAYLDEVFDDFPCQPSCDPDLGTPILVGPSGHVTGVDFALRQGGSISGTVTEAGTGEPVSGPVDVYDSAGTFVDSAFTGPTGRYQVFDLPTGSYFAVTDTFSHADELYDNLPCSGGCTPTQGTPIAVVAGQERAGTDFVLQRLGALAGRVTSAAGAPLSGAHVAVYDAQGSFRTSGFTEESGAYQAGGLAAGNHFATAEANDYLGELYSNRPCHPSCTPTSGTPIPVVLGGVVPGINFSLDLGGSITGTVRRQATGTPIDAHIDVFNAAGGSVDHVHPDATGTYVAAGLGAGTYFASADADEFIDELYREIPCLPACPPATSGTPIPVAVAQSTGGVDFTLTRLGRITGRVTATGTGLPVSAQVWLYDSAGQNASVEFTNTGVYLFDSILPGTYYVRTDSNDNFVDELYSNRTCEPSCTVTTGTPVAAALETTTSGIDFSLRRPVFADVPVTHFAWRYVEAAYNAGVTAGCGGPPLRYCPDAAVSRAQMAVFLLRAKEGPVYLPPPATGFFSDVPAADPFAAWIEELVRREVTGGCAGNPPRYCPNDPTTRAQMAPLLLVTLEGAGYLPPPAVGVFSDVPASDTFARWIEELVRRQVTGGCGANPPRYCPGAPTTRAQMAVFLTAIFGLPLP